MYSTSRCVLLYRYPYAFPNLFQHPLHYVARPMRVRIRGPAGQAATFLSENATVEDLRIKITEKTSISKYELKYGYPPRPLSLSDYAETAKLSEIGIKLDGEQLIVSEITPSASKQAPSANELPKPIKISPSQIFTDGTVSTSSAVMPSSFSFADVGTAPPSSTQKANKPLSLTRKSTPTSLDAPELPLPSHASTLVLRIMPDDNSCLFRAFNTAFFGAMDNMTELRSIIAQNIQANKDTYSAVVLDQQPDDYCRWIQTEDAWGGAIELDILSKHFDVEISSIDVQTLRTDRFNEGRPERCILVYSGYVLFGKVPLLGSKLGSHPTELSCYPDDIPSFGSERIFLLSRPFSFLECLPETSGADSETCVAFIMTLSHCLPQMRLTKLHTRHLNLTLRYLTLKIWLSWRAQ